MPNKKSGNPNIVKDFKNLSKWRIFAKSGHTGWMLGSKYLYKNYQIPIRVHQRLPANRQIVPKDLILPFHQTEMNIFGHTRIAHSRIACKVNCTQVCHLFKNTKHHLMTCGFIKGVKGLYVLYL